MGVVGKKLKAHSIEAQALWSDTMSMVEETLGGLRIIKAFCAEEKMNKRFNQVARFILPFIPLKMRIFSTVMITV